jgi:hypothetical protein
MGRQFYSAKDRQRNGAKNLKAALKKLPAIASRHVASPSRQVQALAVLETYLVIRSTVALQSARHHTRRKIENGVRVIRTDRYSPVNRSWASSLDASDILRIGGWDEKREGTKEARPETGDCDQLEAEYGEFRHGLPVVATPPSKGATLPEVLAERVLKIEAKRIKRLTPHRMIAFRFVVEMFASPYRQPDWQKLKQHLTNIASRFHPHPGGRPTDPFLDECLRDLQAIIVEDWPGPGTGSMTVRERAVALVSDAVPGIKPQQLKSALRRLERGISSASPGRKRDT